MGTGTIVSVVIPELFFPKPLPSLFPCLIKLFVENEKNQQKIPHKEHPFYDTDLCTMFVCNILVGKQEEEIPSLTWIHPARNIESWR